LVDYTILCQFALKTELFMHVEYFVLTKQGCRSRNELHTEWSYHSLTACSLHYVLNIYKTGYLFTHTIQFYCISINITESVQREYSIILLHNN